MKLALVTTPPSIRSGIGDYTRHLLPYLREHCDIELFVADQYAGERLDGAKLHGASELAPKDFERILFQLGNERSHAFMLPLIRSIGGAVALHDWILFDLATAAHPALERGGVKGHAVALQEGGFDAAGIYYRNRRARRQARVLESGSAEHGLDGAGVLLSGWHVPETDGRWTAARAGVRLPSASCRRVAISLSSEPGRNVRVRLADGSVPSAFSFTNAQRETELEFEWPGARDVPGGEAVFELATGAIKRTRAQREHADERVLGCFVRSLRYEDEGGWHTLDLNAVASLPLATRELADDRFRLALNRSVVRNADAFIVHSSWIRRRILDERNQATPIGVVFHGAEKRWRDDDRSAARARLQLPEAFHGGLLLASFGAIQEHKRIDKLLAGLARARRERPEIRLVLAGEIRTERLDIETMIESCDLGDAVHITGYLEEQAGWDFLHASDVAVNLRGPSSGGTSGGIFQALSLGRPVIVSDLEEQRELPDRCVVKIPQDDTEVGAIARALVDLHDDKALRTRLEDGAREFVENECHWSKTAERYAQWLDSFPAHRAVRKSLIQTAIDASDERRREREASS